MHNTLTTWNIRRIHDRDYGTAMQVNDCVFVNLTGKSFFFCENNNHLHKICANQKLVNAYMNFRRREIAGRLIVNQPHWVLTGDLPAPRENTYFIVPEAVLNTYAAKGRTDLIAIDAMSGSNPDMIQCCSFIGNHAAC